MRFHSTPESVEKRKVTILALIECVVALAVYGVVIWSVGSIVPLAITTASAPLFLLRTKYSVKLALSHWERVFDWVDSLPIPLGFFAMIISLPLGIFVRISATITGLVLHPVATVRSMPDNWFRQALCTDLFSAPEIIPGESRSKHVVLTFPTIVKRIPEIWHERKPSQTILFYVILVPIFIIGYLPAILLRISFKASALVYVPLIWVARATVGPSRQLRYRLERYTTSEIEKTRRWIAGTLLVLLFSKAALVGGLVEREYVKSHLGSEKLADLLLAGSPWWHVTLGVDAALTFFLFYYADAVLAKLGKGLPIWASFHHTVISGGSFFRALIAMVTVLYGFFVAAMAIVFAYSTV